MTDVNATISTDEKSGSISSNALSADIETTQLSATITENSLSASVETTELSASLGSVIIMGDIYWERTGTILSPTTDGDDVSVGSGSLYIPTTSATGGIIYKNEVPWMHGYGTNNFFAAGAGNFTTTGNGGNFGLGPNNLSNLTNGSFNIGIGDGALVDLTSATGNFALGLSALRVCNGNRNVSIGNTSQRLNTSGNNNVGIGTSTLYQNESGSDNVAIGYLTGYGCKGSGNILIGAQAGQNANVSNKLYIANSSTATPLIYGDFDTGQVTINTKLKVTALGIGTAEPDLVNYSLHYKKSGSVRAKLEVDGAQNAGYALFDLSRNSLNLGYFGLGSLSSDDVEFATFNTTLGGTGLNGLKFITNSLVRMRLSENGNLGVGTQTPDVSAKLDLTSTTQGFLPPRMTTTQKNAISSPAEGLMVYDTTLKKICFYNGTAWETITSA